MLFLNVSDNQKQLNAGSYTSKASLAVAVMLIVVVGGVAAFYAYNLQGPAENAPPTCSDPDSISSHVYNPERLRLVKECITASGTVEKVVSKNDGDYHVRLKLDSAYANLTNDANDIHQYGDLVVEIVCAKAVTQPDAVAACNNYTNAITIPRAGQHITVSGPYVLDTQHFDWAEIHPVYSLTVS